jgi:hypothetical protein
MMEYEAKRLRRLLGVSNRLLRPFADPLCTDFGAIRFLRNEMAYSDWLAWLVDQLGRADVVLPLFGLETTGSKAEGRIEILKADRESEIAKGRLDLRIMRGKEPLAIVEVKLDKADRADLGSLPTYRRWLEKFRGSAAGRLVLLADGGEKADYEGFRLLTWRDLCLRLRRASSRLIRDKEMTLAAMLLAFVGAVEQNLLLFSHEMVKRTVEKINPTVSSDIPDYLAKFIEGESDADSTWNKRAA